MTEQEAWAAKWINSVVDGASTMSQRKLSSVETRGGGLEAVGKLARAKGVHLVVLQDERGEKLVAASLHPFEIVC